MELTLAEHNLYRAIAELSYIIAKADHKFMKEEVEIFKKTVKEELGQAGWLAESRFDIINDAIHPHIDQAYNHVMFTIKQNRHALSNEMVQKFINVITKVAEVADIVEEEQRIIDKFKEDIAKIYQAS